MKFIILLLAMFLLYMGLICTIAVLPTALEIYHSLVANLAQTTVNADVREYIPYPVNTLNTVVMMIWTILCFTLGLFLLYKEFITPTYNIIEKTTTTTVKRVQDPNQKEIEFPEEKE